MNIRSVVNAIEDFAPRALQESYDNSGLQAGDATNICTGVLLTLDVTELTISEAKEYGFNFVVSHHPLLFKSVKSITPDSAVGRILRSAIKNDISIYSAHTSLDNARYGVSYQMARNLNLVDIQTLQPQADRLEKIVVFVPNSYAETVKSAIAKAGAGYIGDYDACTYSMQGVGSFRAKEGAEPFVGDIGSIHNEPETRIEAIMQKYLQGRVVDSMRAVHPYEEPAYDIIPLFNEDRYSGSGAVGYTKFPVKASDFLESVKSEFKCQGIRYSGDLNKMITKVALCGGSGAFLANVASATGADIYITGDLKYHDFTSFEGDMILVDIGHYESEQCAKDILQRVISNEFPKLPIRQSIYDINTINYM